MSFFDFLLCDPGMRLKMKNAVRIIYEIQIPILYENESDMTSDRSSLTTPKSHKTDSISRNTIIGMCNSRLYILRRFKNA